MSTIDTDDLNNITSELLRECEEDWVALWCIVAKLRKIHGVNFNKENLRALTLQVVAKLLASGKVEAGWPTAVGGWEPWRLSHEAVATRIEAEWGALGEDPHIGAEIVWFTIPAKQPRPK